MRGDIILIRTSHKSIRRGGTKHRFINKLWAIPVLFRVAVVTHRRRHTYSLPATPSSPPCYTPVVPHRRGSLYTGLKTSPSPPVRSCRILSLLGRLDGSAGVCWNQKWYVKRANSTGRRNRPLHCCRGSSGQNTVLDTEQTPKKGRLVLLCPSHWISG